MICFDITDIDSFRNIDNWLEEVLRFCPEKTPIFLVGTKSDLQSKRMVSYATIKAYTDQKNLSYVETSSKTNENIVNCFTNFSEKLVEHTNQIELNRKQSKPNPIDIDNTKPLRGNTCTGAKCVI